ncbi:glycoside hydrolase family 15 protein [Methylibium sp.]|uniref:glycoside hydrolase family 15 protein n=1 Tax=Methylibium sp. TaxID=2067992 RepID=UPI0018266EE3|nr:glycoside hydrolase family 15 protein [Methylibium sp.]MBA3591817.1 glycoside hydrolase family 15 protein [Methylibium sp.]
MRPPGSSLELGLIGNCSISALIDAQARIVWYCLPRFDGDPVFHALLADPPSWPAKGSWTIEIEDFERSEQAYDDGTAILRTRLIGRNGDAIEVVDFAPRFFTRNRPFRPAVLVRRVHPVRGHPRIRISMRPMADWGRVVPQITRGGHHLRYCGPAGTLRLTTDAPITYIEAETWFSLGGPLNLLLGPDETVERGVAEVAREFEEQTAHYWRSWTRALALPLEWQAAVIRAAITLKMCLFEETGAIVAAMTTSIPEAPDSQRNWDYRYCWLRDAFFVVRALNSLSEVGTMEDYLRWLHNVVREAAGGHIQPLYGIGLEKTLPEVQLDHLRGYRGMGPVRVGNQAQEHFQHDVYGNVVLGAAQSFHDRRLFRRADAGDFALLEAVGERAWATHDQPDAGMWELRTRARVHTSSALMSWAACDRLAKIAVVLALPERAIRWRERADTIRERVLTEAWSERRQAFAESLGGNDLDASVLLMAEVGFIDPCDPRFIATVDALEASLCDGPYMRRYEAADDFGKPETAFNICAFWRIDSLVRIGRREQARAIFEAMLAVRNPLGLLSEDTDSRSGELWGNFPQTYSMVGVINAAVRLSAPWDSVI